MIDLGFNNSTDDSSYKSEFFEKILSIAEKETGINDKKVELSLNLVDKDKIQSLNNQYRNKDKPTDVLSFPLGTNVDTKLVQNDIIALGDIFICLPIAKQYAEKEGVSLDFKVTFLTIHGFLHLLGYDHEKSEKENQEMTKLEKQILAKCANV